MSRDVRWGTPQPRQPQPARLHSRLIRRRVVAGGAVNADVTPTTVVAQAFIDTPAVSANADVTPTTVVAQAFIDTPAVTADANITTTTVVAQAFVDTPTVATIRVIHIASAVHREQRVRGPQLRQRSTIVQGYVPTVSANASVTPDTVVATAFIDTPTVSGNADVTPTTVAAQAFVDTPSVTGDAVVTTTTVIGQASVDTPTVSGNADVTPTTVIAQAFIDSPNISTSGDVDLTLATVIATTTIDGVTVTATKGVRLVTAPNRERNVLGPQLTKRSSIVQSQTPVSGAVDANVTPDTVVATAFIDTPTVTATATGGGVVLGHVTSAVTPAPTPERRHLGSRVIGGRLAVTGYANVFPTTVETQAFIPTPTVTGDANVTAGDVAAQASVPTPGISVAGDVNLTTATVIAVAAVDTPTVSGNAGPTAGAVAAVVSVPTPTVSFDADVALTTVAAVAAVPTPTIHVTAAGDVEVTPDTVVAVVNMDALPLVTPGGLIYHRNLIGYGFSNSSPFGNRRP